MSFYYVALKGKKFIGEGRILSLKQRRLVKRFETEEAAHEEVISYIEANPNEPLFMSYRIFRETEDDID